MAVQKNSSSAKQASSSSESGIIHFFTSLVKEVKKISWPHKKEVKKATTTVLTFCVLYAVAIGILDGFFSTIVKLVFK